MCCNIHGLILYLAKVALVAVELCEFALVWVSFFLFFWFFFSLVFSLLSASLQAGFSAFEMLPLFTLGSNRISYNNCWKLNEPAELEYNSEPTTKSNNHSDDGLTIFTEQIFTGQLFSFTITSMLFLGALCFYFLSKKETCHMEGGVVSLVIIKLPYCLCGELIVSVELVTAYKALVHQNVHFLWRTKWGSFSTVCAVYVCTPSLHMLELSYFAEKLGIWNSQVLLMS